MRCCLITAIFVIIIVTSLNGQPPKKEFVPLRSGIIVKSAALTFGGYNSIGYLPVSLEYDRKLSGKTSWVIGASFASMPGSYISYDCGPKGGCYDNTVRNATLTVCGKIAWTLPFARERLFVRAEAGVAGTYFRVLREDRKDLKDKFLPSLTAELYLGVNLSRRFSLLFSPLIVTPSYIRFSPWGIGGRTDKPYFEYNFGAFGFLTRF